MNITRVKALPRSERGAKKEILTITFKMSKQGSEAIPEGGAVKDAYKSVAYPSL